MLSNCAFCESHSVQPDDRAWKFTERGEGELQGPHAEGCQARVGCGSLSSLYAASYPRSKSQRPSDMQTKAEWGCETFHSP